MPPSSNVQLATIPVPGKPNTRLQRRDVTGVYKALCIDLADEIGFKRSEIWELFDECACLREKEMRVPRAYAEHLALEDVKVLCDKRGQDLPN